ncbi:tyrosine-type recombinase/integrase [Magnetospira thiophila]
MKPGDKPLADDKVAGLRLHPGKAKGQGKWLLRYVSPTETISGQPQKAARREMGFGSYPDVGIADARTAATRARDQIRKGIDPINDREAARAAQKDEVQAMTFEVAARRVHDDLKAGWKNGKHAAQWLGTLEEYVIPKIGKRKVRELRAQDFASTLQPIWLDKPETASRVKQRCSAVMDWCVAQEIIGANPVGVVSRLLPKQPGKRERVTHQPSIQWKEVPSFVGSVLRTGKPNLSRLMLEFLILTAARSGEVRAMTWEEVDLEKAVWIIPASRMKAKVEHRVPLSNRAMEILSLQEGKHETLVFPSPTNKVPTDMVLTKFLRDKQVASDTPGRIATAHGFRSSFRNWASENGYPRDWAERALAHTITNQTEAAYHHTDLLEQRRPMMDAWADHVCGVATEDGKVVAFGKGAA